ncbi:MAG: histone-lysine N-methyltransferase, partial [Deltaproteobacteria bacterium]|nr:histone-lysine N-methyltransferase [Deltaproteobacteria bacterium]
MARWNDRRRLLDHVPADDYRPEVKLTDQPNLIRSVFPYEQVAVIDFDQHFIIPEPPARMLITDTTFRDGQQARPPFRATQITQIFKLLSKLSGPRGIIRQSEFFLYSDKDRRAVDFCRELDCRFPEITGWIRAKPEDIKLVREMEIRETGILTSVSDYHTYLKLGLDRKKAFDMYLGIVKEALSAGITPRCHFEDVTRSDIFGFTVPLAAELMRLRQESKIDIKIRLCDTLGFGVTYPGAALPRSVPKLVRALIDEAGVPGHLLEWHGHNDFHKVLVNAATAWLYGCGAVNASLFGLGERTGNAPLEGMVMEYISLTGNTSGLDTTVITELAEYFTTELNCHIPANYPFVGADFNATAAGVHADGLVKNEEIYNIFDTKTILQRPVSIIITDKSGTAGVAYWLNRRLGLDQGTRIDKRHPGVIKIHKKVQAEYQSGRTTSISSEEM